MPAGVAVACGTTKVTLSPTSARRARAKAAPSKMLYPPGLRSCIRPARIRSPTTETLGSSSGNTPSTITPCTMPARVAMPSARMKGADPRTRGSRSITLLTARQSRNARPRSTMVACAVTPRIRPRNSFSKPFITEITVMSAVTPTATPSMEMIDMNEMK